MNKRVRWIDALKGYGIFVVTLGHLGVYFPIEKHIYSYHIFLFFSISGYLFNSKQDYMKYFLKKTKCLFIPFLCWNTVSSVIGAILAKQSFTEFLITYFILNGKLCFNAPIWFLLILYLTEIIYGFIDAKLHLTMNGNYSVFIMSLIMFVLIGTKNIPFKLNLLPLGLFSYCFGVIFKSLEKKWVEKYCGYFMILFASLSLFFGVFLNDRISYTAGYFANIMYCLLAAFFGVLFFMMLFKNLYFRKHEIDILEILGRNSFSIMTMQYYFFTFYQVFAKRIFGIEDIWHSYNSIKAIMLSMLTIILIIRFTSLLKRQKESGMLFKLGRLFGII